MLRFAEFEAMPVNFVAPACPESGRRASVPALLMLQGHFAVSIL